MSKQNAEYYRLYAQKHKHPCPECGKLICKRSKHCAKHQTTTGWRGGHEAAYKRFQQSRLHPCVNCGKQITALATRCKSCVRKGFLVPGAKRCFIKAGYIYIKKPGHRKANKAGYILEHIAVWEQVNGKPLPDSWIIHHLNGIKTDNRPGNLAALPTRKHLFILQAKAKRIQELEGLLNHQHQLF